MAQETLQTTSVRIQNYRSIVDEQLKTDRLIISVGLNEVGKSNLRRALDLFFNGANAAARPAVIGPAVGLSAKCRCSPIPPWIQAFGKMGERAV